MAAIAQQPRTLTTKEADIQLMLAAEVHLGTKNCDFQMERYVFRRHNDGIYIINAGKTWDKLHMAARVIVSIENPQDIIVQSARPYGQRAVLKFAQYTGNSSELQLEKPIHVAISERELDWARRFMSQENSLMLQVKSIGNIEVTTNYPSSVEKSADSTAPIERSTIAILDGLAWKSPDG
ncbi:40S ribosomal protein SA-like [Solanum stenotomum]|uniref:40S ribosomal protein SA-like n=1 Tax=Solanum stenotomum TaxID=172797 RepID=UPI0020D1F152|nr:40S ribosomal protein SA-like [Solanum stenotomum]